MLSLTTCNFWLKGSLQEMFDTCIAFMYDVFVFSLWNEKKVFRFHFFKGLKGASHVFAGYLTKIVILQHSPLRFNS